jgi:hypothetical protein
MKDEKFRKYFAELKADCQMMDAVNKDVFAPRLVAGASDFHVEITDKVQEKFERMLADQEGLTMEQLRSLQGITYLTPRGENPKDSEVGTLNIIEPKSKTDAFMLSLPADGEKMLYLLMGVGRAKAQGVRSGYIDVIMDRPKITDK